MAISDECRRVGTDILLPEDALIIAGRDIAAKQFGEANLLLLHFEKELENLVDRKTIKPEEGNKLISMAKAAMDSLKRNEDLKAMDIAIDLLFETRELALEKAVECQCKK